MINFIKIIGRHDEFSINMANWGSISLSRSTIVLHCQGNIYPFPCLLISLFISLPQPNMNKKAETLDVCSFKVGQIKAQQKHNINYQKKKKKLIGTVDATVKWVFILVS